jgi:hypothetical protein
MSAPPSAAGGGVADGYNRAMRLRALLAIVVLVLVGAGCGTTGEAATDDTPSTTTADDPPSSEETEPDRGPIASIEDEDLGRVLPKLDDLPAGWKETEVPEPSDGKTTYEPGTGCEALAAVLGRNRDDEAEANVSERSFVNDQNVQINAWVAPASDEFKALFEDIGERVKDCERLRATGDGSTINAHIAAGPISLGDDGYVLDMTGEIEEGSGLAPTGLTLVSVIHGDAAFSVQVVDGYDDADNRVTRDPMIARDLATEMEEKLGVLLGD